VGRDLVGLGDPAGQGGNLAVGDRPCETAERTVEALAGRDLDADVDLLVRHASAGEVPLVLQEVVAPARQRSRGVGIVDLSPPADRIWPAGDPQMDLAVGQLGIGVGAVDDHLLAHGVGPEGPALTVLPADVTTGGLQAWIRSNVIPLLLLVIAVMLFVVAQKGGTGRPRRSLGSTLQRGAP